MRCKSIITVLTFCCLFVLGCGLHPASDTGQGPATAPDAADTTAGAARVEQPGDVSRTTQFVGPRPEIIRYEVIGNLANVYWLSINPGDYNRDSVVNGLDVFLLAANFNRQVTEEPGLECIDGNGDGTLNGLDLFLISSRFETRIDGYEAFVSDFSEGPFEGPVDFDDLGPYPGCNEEVRYQFPTDGLGPKWVAAVSVDAELEQLSAPSEPVRPMGAPEVDGLTWTGGNYAVRLGWQPWTDYFHGFERWEIQLKETTAEEWTHYGYVSENTGSGDWNLVQATIEGESGDVIDIRVRGLNLEGSSGDWSELAGVHISGIMDDPFRFWADPGDNQVILTFDDVSDPEAYGYNIYRADELAGPYERLESPVPFERIPPTLLDDGSESFTYIDDTVVNGNEYHYAVGAVDFFRTESFKSSYRSVTPKENEPAPTGLTVTNLNGAVQLEWEEYWSNPAELYEIGIGAGHGPPFDAEYQTSELQYIVPNLTNETEYFIRLRARFAGNYWSDYTDEVSGHPSAPPSAPTGLAAGGKNASKDMIFTWDEIVDPDTAQVELLYRPQEEDPWESYVILASDIEKTVLKTEDRGSAWLFTICGLDQWGVKSEYAPQISIDPPAWEVTILELGEENGNNVEIANNALGYPLIGYGDTAGQNPKLAEWDGSEWTITALDTAVEDGMATSLVIIPGTDQPAFTHRDTTNENILYTVYDGSSWSSHVVDSNGEFYWTTSAAVDGSDRVGVAYCLAESGDLRYSYNTGSADEWSTESFDSGSDFYRFPSLGFDAASNPGIAWQGTESDALHYTHFDGSDWNTVVVDDAGGRGRDPSLLFDQSGNPVIAYGGTGVWLARFDGSQWTIDQVSSFHTTFGTALLLDEDDSPIISYVNYWDDATMAAWKTGDEWVNEELLYWGSPSQSDLAFDENGNPLVAFKFQEYGGGDSYVFLAWLR